MLSCLMQGEAEVVADLEKDVMHWVKVAEDEECCVGKRVLQKNQGSC